MHKKYLTVCRFSIKVATPHKKNLYFSMSTYIYIYNMIFRAINMIISLG